ncbi:MAG: peptidase M28, partial [bacterium]|nr:peptidase M28 [bacterium]
MRVLSLGLPLLSLLWANGAMADAEADRGAIWWGHVQTLASDDLQGRGTGTPGYDKAADYVIGQVQALGLKPAGIDGYKQQVA